VSYSVLLVVCTLLIGGCTPRASNTGVSRFSSKGKVEAERFVVIGDWGTGLDSSERVARRMCRWRKDHPFGLVVTTGDNIYPDGSSDYFEPNFFDPFGCLLDAGVKWRSALGNHDVVTDNVVAFHHPVYSPGDHGSTPGFAEWMPSLFARRGVDIVVNGHDHLYAVSKKLDGIRYVVTGGGGASLYDCHEHPLFITCKERHHFLYVRVTVDRLVVQAVPDRGAVLHTFATRGIE
jgi:hypothetical protein